MKLLIILIILALAPLTGTFLLDHLTRVDSMQMQIEELKRSNRPIIEVHVYSGAILDLIATQKEVIIVESGVSSYVFQEVTK